MRGDKSIFIFFAHPSDAEFGISATAAKLARQGSGI